MDTSCSSVDGTRSHDETTQHIAGSFNVLIEKVAIMLRFNPTLFLRVWSPWRVSVL